MAIISTVDPDARVEFSHDECWIVVGVCEDPAIGDAGPGLRDRLALEIVSRRWAAEQIARLDVLGWGPAIDEDTDGVCFMGVS